MGMYVIYTKTFYITIDQKLCDCEIFLANDQKKKLFPNK